MSSSEQLLARIQAADNLLKNELPAADRQKIAQLRLIDQARLLLRQRRPDFDQRHGPKEPKPPVKEPPQT